MSRENRKRYKDKKEKNIGSREGDIQGKSGTKLQLGEKEKKKKRKYSKTEIEDME